MNKAKHLFRDVYSLCVAYPEPLADRLYNETKLFLDLHVSDLLCRVTTQGETGLLQAYYNAWTEYSQGIDYLHQLYLYLNQQHIKKQKTTEAEIIYGAASATTADYQEQMEIGELGLHIWKSKMITPLWSSLLSLLLAEIHADRMGKAQHTSTDVIRGVIRSLIRVEEYKKKGELDVRKNFYTTLFHFFFFFALLKVYCFKYLCSCFSFVNCSYIKKISKNLSYKTVATFTPE